MRWGSQAADQCGWDRSGGGEKKNPKKTQKPHLLSNIQSSKAASDHNIDVCSLQPHLHSSKQEPRNPLSACFGGAQCELLPPQPHSGFIHNEGWERLFGLGRVQGIHGPLPGGKKGRQR